VQSLGLDDSVWEVLGVLTMDSSLVAAAEQSIAQLTPGEAQRLKLHVVGRDPGRASFHQLYISLTLRETDLKPYTVGVLVGKACGRRGRGVHRMWCLVQIWISLPLLMIAATVGL
jgi:hypothetical protein